MRYLRAQYALNFPPFLSVHYFRILRAYSQLYGLRRVIIYLSGISKNVQVFIRTEQSLSEMLGDSMEKSLGVLVLQVGQQLDEQVLAVYYPHYYQQQNYIAIVIIFKIEQTSVKKSF
ncbi:hypothetical protein FGO68_gene6003 [Halteria grandinella]|uniref:Uncharacterized protein n=1 Tax=Halteria grandinella TaxID=5974 RepID=A0A8J8T374_HALGN|nr:hypothetical protein FGO68_gene6003 [Halteria grandinella]